MREAKYYVEVKTSEKGLRVDKQVLESLKGVLSSKNIAKMKKEYVECPVVNKQVAFLLCFNCVSFIRRVEGKVHCEGREFRQQGA